jgi:hypothetical protein
MGQLGAAAKSDFRDAHMRFQWTMMVPTMRGWIEHVK